MRSGTGTGTAARVGWLTSVLLLAVACGGGGITVNNSGIPGGWPGINEQPFHAQREIADTWPVTGLTGLRVELQNGDVRIQGQVGIERIEISAILRVGADTWLRAQAGLDEMEIALGADSGELLVEARHPANSRHRVFDVDLTITVPESLPVTLIQANGSIVVDGVACPVDVDLENGQVRLENHNAGASVSLVNGGVSAQVILPPGEVLDLTTENGWIDLGMPGSTSATVDASSANGEIRVDGLEIPDAVRTPGGLRGTLGDGSGEIDVRVLGNGSISLTRID